MAGRYRKVSVQVWGDAKFRTFSVNAKLVFLFILTHPQMTSLGAMRATIPGLAAEMDLDLKAFEEAFQEVLRKGCVSVDSTAPLLTLPRFIRHNKPESPNVVRSWATILDTLPECDLLRQHFGVVLSEFTGFKLAFLEALPEAFREALPEAFREAYAKASLNPEPEPEPEQEPEQEPHPHPRARNTPGGGGGASRKNGKHCVIETEEAWNG